MVFRSLHQWLQGSQAIRLNPLDQRVIVAFLAQVSGVGLSYGSQIVLARWLGVVEFGIYEYVVALVVLLGILAGLGLPTAVLRFIAQYQVTRQWGELQGIIRGSWGFTALMGLGLTMTLGTVIKLVHPIHGIYYPAVLVGIWLIPLLALAQLQTEMARAIQQIGLAYIPVRIVAPLLMLGGALLWLNSNLPLKSEIVLGLSGVSLVIVLGGQWVLIQWQYRDRFPTSTPVYQPLTWLRVSLPLLLQGVFMVILNQTDILMIGAWMTPEAVGIYSVAAKTAIWANFVLQAINTVIAPLFTTLYTQRDQSGLRSLVRKAAHWIFWPSLVLIAGLAIFSGPILQLFGQDFIAAQPSMLTLLVGQLFNVGCGSVGYLMVMTGHQNESAMIFGWSALANVILNGILIPHWGILGAAIATALTMSLWNVWLHVLVVRHLQVYPSIVYGFQRQ
ncbi:MAG: flippase [Oscillatoriales cyanobacterium RM1_1_9]|nr:flippase [Oscillatoriales cyanobacterium RM2_1_1]NJO71695.1 flippase [Oscillatoriales cyanobacterium RM1_1_9]